MVISAMYGRSFNPIIFINITMPAKVHILVRYM